MGTTTSFSPLTTSNSAGHSYSSSWSQPVSFGNQKARLRTVEIKQWKHLWTAGWGHRPGPRDPASPTPVPSGSLLLAGLFFFFVKILTTRFQSDHSDIICRRTGLKRTITAAEVRRFLKAEIRQFPWAIISIVARVLKTLSQMQAAF